MPIAAKNGKLIVNQAGSGLRTNCPSSCVAKLTQYTYSPCNADAGGANNYHRALRLNPQASALDLTAATPSFSWSRISGIIGASWNYTKDSNVIPVVKAMSRNAVSAGCVTAELGGSLAEAGTFAGAGAVWLDNAPCCHYDCSNRNGSGTFYYNVTVSGGCGKAYCTWWYEDTFGTPVAFNRTSGSVRGSNGLWWSPNYTFQAGSHDISTTWMSSTGFVPDSWGLLVVFLA